MQKTCNNCFRSKICSTTLCQAKTGKHEHQNVAVRCMNAVRCCYILPLALTYFALTKGHATYFRPETISLILRWYYPKCCSINSLCVGCKASDFLILPFYNLSITLVFYLLCMLFTFLFSRCCFEHIRRALCKL